MKDKILGTIDSVNGEGVFKASWDSLEQYQIPEWYQNAKLGIFIHWGVYSVPAHHDWYGNTMYEKGHSVYKHHRETYGPQDQFGYKDFIPMFKGEKFDAADWAALFKQAGARFVVPVAEHHDGFQMYESALSEWNAAKMGPKRDIVGELSEAVRREGMTFGVSSHRAEHAWFFGGGMEFPSDVQDPAYRSFYGPALRHRHSHLTDDYLAAAPDRDFLEDWLARTCELIDKYQPEILWFDWWIMNLAFKPYLKKMAAYYYNRAIEWNKQVAINYKFDAFPVGTAVLDIERGQLSKIRPMLWQNDTSLSKNSWVYIKNREYKEVGDILADFVDIVSKNGALLLNIGPRSDGTIPEEERYILLEIGEWLARNGEGIYDTRPWHSFGEGPTRVESGSFKDTARPPFTSQDIRFTLLGETLFAFVLKWPDNQRITIRSLAKGRLNTPAGFDRIHLLGDDGPLTWTWDESGLHIDLSNCQPQPYPFAVKIEMSQTGGTR